MDGEFDLKFDFDLLAELAPIDEFLVNEIDDITISQVCVTLECENAALEGLLELYLTPDSAGCGAMDVDGIATGAMDVDCKDSASTSSDSRFGQPVRDDELFKLIRDQENVNTKNNTKWAMNLFDK